MAKHYTHDNLPVCSGIYSITHVATKRRYIGSARNLRRRIWDHRSRLRHERHGNLHLQRAWNKYGEKEFAFEVLETCLDSPAVLIVKEQAWIDQHIDLLFNSRKIAEQFSGIWYRMEESIPTKEAAGRRMKAYRQTTSTLICQYCSKEFVATNPCTHIKFCSRHCNYASKRFHRLCERCNRPFVTSCRQSRFCSPHCKALHNHATRLDDETVQVIRMRLADGHVQRQIAKDLGISCAAVCRINRGVRYRQITSAPS